MHPSIFDVLIPNNDCIPTIMRQGGEDGIVYGSHLVSHMHQLGDHAIAACDGVRNRRGDVAAVFLIVGNGEEKLPPFTDMAAASSCSR